MACGSLGDVIENFGEIPEKFLGEISLRVLDGLVYIHKQVIYVLDNLYKFLLETNTTTTTNNS